MNDEVLMKIIEQLKKYELVRLLGKKEKDFDDWILSLNNKQINNFLNLDIDIEEVKNIKKLLINKDLLNCEDYGKRVKAISTLKNGDECWHLFDVLCEPIFLNSKNFYKDIEMLSKAYTAKDGLCALGSHTFINSPYHDEDLKLIVEVPDVEHKDLISDALGSVASNINSINSPYHQADMELISKANAKCLQFTGTYPPNSINNLATNPISLKDKYHLENMQILANNPISKEFLYEIMTDPEVIKGKYYRKEVAALLNAKSEQKARAMYCYITNTPPIEFYRKKQFYKYSSYEEYDKLMLETPIPYYEYKELTRDKKDFEYINNLNKINKIDDVFVIHYTTLLMTPQFVKSVHKNFDLELLRSVSDASVFGRLFNLMRNEASLNSAHHKKDAVIISQTKDDGLRRILFSKAISKCSLESDNHEYDMKYISKLDLENISEEIKIEMHYYLFTKDGINDEKRIEKLEKLSQGELVDRSNLPDYLECIKTEITSNFNVNPKTNEPNCLIKKIKSRQKR